MTYWVVAEENVDGMPRILKLAQTGGNEEMARTIFEAIANGGVYDRLYLLKVVEVKK